MTRTNTKRVQALGAVGRLPATAVLFKPSAVPPHGNPAPLTPVKFANIGSPRVHGLAPPRTAASSPATSPDASTCTGDSRPRSPHTRLSHVGFWCSTRGGSFCGQPGYSLSRARTPRATQSARSAVRPPANSRAVPEASTWEPRGPVLPRTRSARRSLSTGRAQPASSRQHINARWIPPISTPACFCPPKSVAANLADRVGFPDRNDTIVLLSRISASPGGCFCELAKFQMHDRNILDEHQQISAQNAR